MFAFNEEDHSYWLDGKRAPNVTTIKSGGIPVPALVDWSARVTAEWVYDHQAELPTLMASGRAPTVSFLQGIHDEVRNKAAVKGTLIHRLAEDIVHGKPVEVPQELTGHVAGYLRFLDAFQLEPILTERPVANRTHRYAGKPDLVAHLEGRTWLLDNKTSANVYADTAVQCAAYARAELYLDEQGNECPMPPIEAMGVVHIGPQGTELYDLGSIDAGFAEFLAALATYEGTKRRRRLLGAPLMAASQLEALND